MAARAGYLQALGRGVHPPFSAARLAPRLRAHPPLWPVGQPQRAHETDASLRALEGNVVSASHIVWTESLSVADSGAENVASIRRIRGLTSTLLEASIAAGGPAGNCVLNEAAGRPVAMGVASQAARRRSPSEALLSNDVVVINGWLDQLVALAETDPMIGIAGPMTNSSSPDDLKSIHRFAAQSRSERLGR